MLSGSERIPIRRAPEVRVTLEHEAVPLQDDVHSRLSLGGPMFCDRLLLMLSVTVRRSLEEDHRGPHPDIVSERSDRLWALGSGGHPVPSGIGSDAGHSNHVTAIRAHYLDLT